MKHGSLYIAFLLMVRLSSAFAQTPEPLKTPPNLSKIAFLGDSITVGVGVKDLGKERYSTVATRLLSTRHAGITEINLGQSGRALCHQNSGYAGSVLEQKPDAVVIQWGVNDQFWGFSVGEFIARYDALVAALRLAKPGMPIVVMTLIADFRWPDNQDVWIGEANVAVQEIAARYGCHVADVHRALDHQKSFYADTIHPNTAGAEVMAKTIVAALESPRLSRENSAVSFDQGVEVRFLQNVFLPKREGLASSWVQVRDLNAKGMTIESKVPIAIRTAPIYGAGTYRIAIHTASGELVSRVESTVNWSQMHSFTFDPKGHEGPLRVAIQPVESAGK
jgi:lysophospholipase L1-like esterase